MYKLDTISTNELSLRKASLRDASHALLAIKVCFEPLCDRRADSLGCDLHLFMCTCCIVSQHEVGRKMLDGEREESHVDSGWEIIK